MLATMRGEEARDVAREMSAPDLCNAGECEESMCGCAQVRSCHQHPVFRVKNGPTLTIAVVSLRCDFVCRSFDKKIERRAA